MFRELADAPIGEALPKVDPKEPTLDGFIAWLEMQPADKSFNWGDAANCAMAQWWASTGVPKKCSYGNYSMAIMSIGWDWTNIVRTSWSGDPSDLKTWTWTFGATTKALKWHRDAQLRSAAATP